MPSLLRAFVAFILAGTLAACGSMPADPIRPVAVGDLKFLVLEEGQYETIGEVVDRAAPGTAAGKVGEHGDIRLVQRGSSIPARKGVTFGYRYQVEGGRDGPMTGAQMHVIHPPMRGVDGNIHTSQTASIDLFFERGVAQDNIVYILAEDFEVLPGTWTLQILFDGKVAASRSFQLR